MKFLDVIRESLRPIWNAKIETFFRTAKFLTQKNARQRQRKRKKTLK